LINLNYFVEYSITFKKDAISDSLKMNKIGFGRSYFFCRNIVIINIFL